MALSQADIDALELAIVSGVKKVKFSDRETEYRDLAEMKQILNDARASVSGTRRRVYTAGRYHRGYQ
jgi:cell division protein FtsX